jgi:Lipocalin-like domain
MNRRMLLISLLLAVLGPTAEAAEDNPLLGTWKLKSFVREVLATGERYNQMGEQPDGYLSYSADGRMLAFFVSDNQPRPRADPTDEERIKLHKGCLPMAARTNCLPGRLFIALISNGTDADLELSRVRLFTLDGDRLVIKTEPDKSPIDGREGMGILTFERVKSAP